MLVRASLAIAPYVVLGLYLADETFHRRSGETWVGFLFLASILISGLANLVVALLAGWRLSTQWSALTKPTRIVDSVCVVSAVPVLVYLFAQFGR
jgi:hypothetical protein